MKRVIDAGCTRSLPLARPTTPLRSSPAMSSSEIRRTARSNAKFGPPENGRGWLASSRIHRAGSIRNAIGLVNTAGRPHTVGKQIPWMSPMS